MTERVLILGNADTAEIDLSPYTYVCIFNDCRHAWAIPKATHHFMRSAGQRFGGQDLWQATPSNCRVCIVDPCVIGNRILEEARNKQRLTRVISADKYRTMGGNYTNGKIPSTGFCALGWFLDFKRFQIDMAGFTFEGVKAHDWSHERKVVEAMHDDDSINLIGRNKPEPFAGTRLAHFVWLSKINGEKRDLDGRMWYAIMSFMALHSHWKTTLWTNCQFDGKLIDQCREMGLIEMDYGITDRHLVADGENLIEKVDFVKWSILRDHGGLVMDTADTLTVANFDDMYDRAHRLKWSHWDQECKRMGGGWLMINRAGADIARKVVEEFLSNYQPKAITGRLESYAMQILKDCKDVDQSPTSRDIVFGAGVGAMENNVIPNNTLKPISPLARQLHFYSGNTWVSERHLKKRASLDSYAIPEHWNRGNNIYTIPFAQTIAKAPAEWRKRFLDLVTVPIVSNWTMPEHVVVISLARRQDRRNLILADAEAAGLELSFFDAFPPVKDAKGWTRGPAELSCSISHQAVIRMAQSCGWLSVLVLEDDSVIPHDFTQRLNSILAGCPDSADILVLGHNRHCKDKSELVPISSTVGTPAIPDIWGLQCYIVRSPAYSSLLQQWEKYRNPIDIDLSNSPHLNPHYSLVPLVHQRNAFGDSDIKAVGKPPTPAPR